MKQVYIFCLLAFPLISVGQISGRVWRDNNPNGCFDSNENYIPTIIIQAYNSAGQLIAKTTSTSEGSYYLPVETGQFVRLEFSDLPPGWHPSPGQTKLRLIMAPAEIHLGLFRPIHYIGPNAKAIQAVYINGNYTAPGIDSLGALVRLQASSSSIEKPERLASPKQVGAVWGLTYQRQADRLFAAALAKRHSAFGPAGSGGIYELSSLSKENPASRLHPFISLDELGIRTGPANLVRDLHGGLTSVSHDSLMFSLVGKMGLGGLAISEDGKDLFVMNLYDRKLYRLVLSTDGHQPTRQDVEAYSFSQLSNTTGEFRPFAVKYYEGNVYVGGIWDATHSGKASDLKASVLVMTPANASKQFTEIFSTRLDYPRGTLDYGISGWLPWIDDYNQARVPNAGNWLIHPQPMLADIEFDTDGSMILGFMDRLGHQTGDGQQFHPVGSPQLELYRGLSGGDVLRVARFRQRYQLEQNGQLNIEASGLLRSAGQGNGEGPGGGEFYLDDQFMANGITWHRETAMGGLALLPETGELLVASREPLAGQYQTGGVKWFSNQTGQATGGRALFPSGAQPGYFWKTNNVGDIALIPTTPPTELGDRVWHDRNENGMQDADEPGLAGIQLGLYLNGKLIATTQTDNKGQYVFRDSSVTGGIQAHTAYEIRIPLEQSSYPGLHLPRRRPASPDFATSLPDEVDNNAVVEGNQALIRLTTAAAGESLRGLDAGLRYFSREESSEVAAKFTLTPNPAGGQSELLYRALKRDGSVSIHLRDSGGRLLQSHTGLISEGVCRKVLELGHLEAGQYYVTVTEDAQPLTRSLLKH